MKNATWMVLACAALGACGGEPANAGTGSAASHPAPASSPKASASATGTAEPAPAAPASDSGLSGPATVEGAAAVVKELQTASDPLATMKRLMPSVADLKEIFTDADLAQLLYDDAQKNMANAKPDDKFPEGTPDVFCASSDDVTAWTAPVQDNFPGGYKRVGPKLTAGLTLCKFKVGGISMDALVNLKGKWVLVSKPFRQIK